MLNQMMVDLKNFKRIQIIEILNFLMKVIYRKDLNKNRAYYQIIKSMLFKILTDLVHLSIPIHNTVSLVLNFLLKNNKENITKIIQKLLT